MIIAGNWKMNMNRQDSAGLMADLAAYQREAAKQVNMIVFPPAVLIDTVVAANYSGQIAVGGQDCHASLSGAHTGDIAAPMLVEAGCSWVLTGHSERRADHGETSADVAAKAGQAVSCGLKAMICVGETLAERESGAANDVVETQVISSLPEGVAASSVAVAYEPVWAIGTGKVASPGDIELMHAHIRAVLCSVSSEYRDVPILYGGSVKPDNAADIFSLPEVGGALVGGASLKAADFIAIARAAEGR
ncbi:triose-phosphate isomerase [Alphaproteobacteria bacterium LSUCC0684]